MDKLIEYRLELLEDGQKDHGKRIHALELGYAKLMALAAGGAAVGGFLAHLVLQWSSR